MTTQGSFLVMDSRSHAQKKHDARFIAASRTDVPDLVAAVRQLQQDNRRLRGRANRLGTELRFTQWKLRNMESARDALGAIQDARGETTDD